MMSSGEYKNSPEFSETDRSIIEWAEHVARGTASKRDDIYENVSNHLSDVALVELTLTICYLDMRNKFNDAMKVPIEEKNYIERSLNRKKDPAELKAYLQAVIDEWPEEFPEEIA